MTPVHENAVQVRANHSDVTVCSKEYSAMAHQFLITETLLRASALHVEFVLDKLALAQVFLHVLRYSHVNYHSTSTLHSFINREGVNEPATVRSSTQTVSPHNNGNSYYVKTEMDELLPSVANTQNSYHSVISLTLKYPF
jgi:hypothetical protein